MRSRSSLSSPIHNANALIQPFSSAGKAMVASRNPAEFCFHSSTIICAEHELLQDLGVSRIIIVGASLLNSSFVCFRSSRVSFLHASPRLRRFCPQVGLSCPAGVLQGQRERFEGIHEKAKPTPSRRSFCWYFRLLACFCFASSWRLKRSQRGGEEVCVFLTGSPHKTR